MKYPMQPASVRAGDAGRLAAPLNQRILCPIQMCGNVVGWGKYLRAF